MISRKRENELNEIMLELEKKAEAAGIRNIIIVLNDSAEEGIVHISTRAVGWERIILCLDALDSALHHAGYLDMDIHAEWLTTCGNIRKEIERRVREHRGGEWEV